MRVDALSHRIAQSTRPPVRRPYPGGDGGVAATFTPPQSTFTPPLTALTPPLTVTTVANEAASAEFDRQFDAVWATDSDAAPLTSTVTSTATSTPHRRRRTDDLTGDAEVDHSSDEINASAGRHSSEPTDNRRDEGGAYADSIYRTEPANHDTSADKSTIEDSFIR